MRTPPSCHRKDPSDMTRSELVVTVRRLRKIIDDRPFRGLAKDAVVAVDRTGNSYTRDALLSVFERVYPDNPKALTLMFPTMSMRSVRYRARSFGIGDTQNRFVATEDAVIKKHFPNYRKAAAELGKTLVSIRRRAVILGIQNPPAGPRWTPEEDALLRQGKPVPGRHQRGLYRRRKILGINEEYVTTARGMPIQELRKLVEAHVARNYPEQYRAEAVSDVIEACLEGRCGTEPAQLIAAGKKAISAGYKMHPDRGAPISMDAKLFDDGEATVGDRISSDAFHF